MSLVTLITDFGLHDPYVGIMKAMIVERCAQARLVDLTHDVPRQDVSIASFWIQRTLNYFPTGTVHLAVVDPGVGTSRQAIAVKHRGHLFVLPNNGLLSDLLLEAQREKTPANDWRAVELRPTLWPSPPRPVGTTFHGRDLFSPAAGLLAAGAAIEDLGRPIAFTDLESLALERQSGRARVRVVDHYGNLITDAPNHHKGTSTVYVDDSPLPWAESYGAARPGQLVALAGSWGTIEVAVNLGNAQRRTGAQVGTLLSLAPGSPR